MDIWRTALVFFRRWYLTLPAMLLSIAVSGWVYVSVPTHYVSLSVLVLTTPTSGGSLPVNPEERNAQTNPLLNFDRGLATSAAILIQMLGSPKTGAKVGAPRGGDTTYQVTNGSTNPEVLSNEPFVFIQADSTSPTIARNVVLGLIDEAKIELASRQRELQAPPSTYIALGEVVPPTTPLPQQKSKMRAVAAALVLGFVVSLCAAFGSESIAEARRERRHADSPGIPDMQVAGPVSAMGH